MRFSHVLSAGLSHVGRKRKNNEDAVVLLSEHGIFCVADGMGGAEDGEVASRAIVDALMDAFGALEKPDDAPTVAQKTVLVCDALNKASAWIKKRSDRKGLRGSGSTAVVMVFDARSPNRASVLHAGDSRAYRFRGNNLRQLTEDHSIAQTIDIGDRKKLPPMFRGIITRAVGIQCNVEIEETSIDVEQDDFFLLCSDGLTEMVSDEQLSRIFQKRVRDDLPELAQLLVDAANRAGGIDNITVILIRVGRSGQAPVADDLAAATIPVKPAPARALTPAPDLTGFLGKWRPALPYLAALLAMLGCVIILRKAGKGPAGESVSKSEQVPPLVSSPEGRTGKHTVAGPVRSKESDPGKIYEIYRNEINELLRAAEIQPLIKIAVLQDGSEANKAAFYLELVSEDRRYVLNNIREIIHSELVQLRVFGMDPASRLEALWSFLGKSNLPRPELMAAKIADMEEKIRALKKWLDQMSDSPMSLSDIRRCPAAMVPEITADAEEVWDRLWKMICRINLHISELRKRNAGDEKTRSRMDAVRTLQDKIVRERKPYGANSSRWRSEANHTDIAMLLMQIEQIRGEKHND